MVGQAVGATGESPKDDRQDAGPTQDARPTKSYSFSRLLLRIPIGVWFFDLKHATKGIGNRITNLEYLRRLSGLSQMQVAFKFKRHVSLISKLERAG